MAPPALEKDKIKQRGTTDPVAQASGQTQSPLLAPHALILKDLSSKYNVLAQSVISSTGIGKRVVQATTHLQPTTGAANASGEKQTKQNVVLMYARTAEVGKMITIVEQCKRILAEQGLSWWQYNQMFDLPEDQQKQKKRKREDGVDVTMVEETKLPGEEAGTEQGDSDSESDAFETMRRERFEKATGLVESERNIMSLRIFLSTAAIPEVRSRDGVTVQSSQDS